MSERIFSNCTLSSLMKLQKLLKTIKETKIRPNGLSIYSQINADISLCVCYKNKCSTCPLSVIARKIGHKYCSKIADYYLDNKYPHTHKGWIIQRAKKFLPLIEEEIKLRVHK